MNKIEYLVDTIIEQAQQIERLRADLEKAEEEAITYRNLYFKEVGCKYDPISVPDPWQPPYQPYCETDKIWTGTDGPNTTYSFNIGQWPEKS